MWNRGSPLEYTNDIIRMVIAKLEQVDKAEGRAIYAALGRFYRRLHSIHNAHSGWIDGPGRVYDLSPNDQMHHAVLVEEGKKAVERGLIDARTHARIIEVSRKNLDYLKNHTPSLVTGGALYWAVYLEGNGGWRVTKLMDLHDLLYWDPAWDLASIKYPAFLKCDPENWKAFISEYLYEGVKPQNVELQV